MVMWVAEGGHARRELITTILGDIVVGFCASGILKNQNKYSANTN